MTTVTQREVRYLDMMGDGVPDAVEQITRRTFRDRDESVPDVVEETRRLEYGIGISGRADGVSEEVRVLVRDPSGRLRAITALRDVRPAPESDRRSA